MKKTLATIAAVLFMAGALASCQYQLKEVEALRADRAGRAFANSLNGKFLGCSGQDSTSDGYVTCTGTDARGTAYKMQCSYRTAEAGCKLD